MNSIRNILLSILLIQLLVFLYVKLIHEDTSKSNHTISKQVTLDNLVSKSLTEVLYKRKELPQSSEYTEWNEKKIANLNKKIEEFNKKMKKIVTEHIPVEKDIFLTKGFIKKIAVKDATKIIKPIPKISIRNKVATYAKAKLGKKYAWGATGPLSFDCSGFTREVYKSTTGIKIPRVSRDQAKVGTYIKYEELKRGDMVFFDTEKKYSGKVNHVGIYLNNGSFIHASSAKKKVVITNFKKKPFYKKRFLWGRRVINKQS